MAMKLVDAEQLEADLTSVADSIRAKTGGEDALAFPSGFESALDTIESADSAFEELEYEWSNGYKDYSHYMVYKQHLSEYPSKLLRHTSSGTAFNNMFNQCYRIKEFPPIDTSNGENLYRMFYDCTSVITIGGIDVTKATSIHEMFYNCTKLENLTFNGVIKINLLNLSHCTLLTHDSLMSVINALYDHATAGTSGTFKATLGSTNLAKLTDAEKAIATQKGWTLA